jgi:hypothetical protein
MVKFPQRQASVSWIGCVRIAFRYEKKPIINVTFISTSHINMAVHTTLVTTIAILVVGAVALLFNEHHILTNTLPRVMKNDTADGKRAEAVSAARYFVPLQLCRFMPPWPMFTA